MIFLTPVERYRASTSTSVMIHHLVSRRHTLTGNMSYKNTGRLSESMNVRFTLHTELRASVPEFTISCRTHGGSATTVSWTVFPVQEGSDHESSQVILDTSHNSVYDNRLRVRGRGAGTYSCTITGRFIDSSILARSSQTIAGVILLTKAFQDYAVILTVAGEPTRLKTVISGSTCTHVNVTVSWESPGGDVSGYMIYYQTEGGPVISDKVSGGERETHSLDGLQRGVTYYISILALSQHLPSPLVGPVSVNTGASLVSLYSIIIQTQPMIRSLSLEYNPLLYHIHR